MRPTLYWSPQKASCFTPWEVYGLNFTPPGLRLSMPFGRKMHPFAKLKYTLMNQWVWTAAQSWNYRPWLWMHSCGEAGTQSQGCETVNYRAYKIIHMWNRQVRWFPIMNPPKPKWIVHENHKHLLRKSPCQAGAWRSFRERQAPAWPLDGMFFIGYYLIRQGT